MRGTNPLKVKKKSKTRIKPSGVAKADEKPAFIKKCMKNLNSAITLANAINRSAKDVTKKSEETGTLHSGQMEVVP